MTWEKRRFGELIRIKHGWAFKGEHFAGAGELVLLTPGNFREEGGLRIRDEKNKYYVGDFPPDYLLARDDLIVVMTDLKQTAPILGASARVPEDKRFLHNQRLGLVTISDPDRLDVRFAYHIFNTPMLREQIRATATGATVRHTAPERIYSCEVMVPDIVVQEQVAAALDRYDDLIANNLRRMALLEEAVHLLYREWFVRLRFPGFEQAKLSGGVPAAWTLSELGALVEVVKDGVHPAELDANTPYVGLEHIPRRCMVLDEWGIAAEVASNKLRFRKRDILFGKIRPYLHKVASAPIDGVCSSDTIVIRPLAEGNFGVVLGLVASSEFVRFAHQTSTEGSKMPRAHWPSMSAHPVLLPPDPLREEFNEFVQTRVSLIENLLFQNRLLAEARDILLPGLMNGSLQP